MAALVASGYVGPFMFEVGHKKYPGGVTPSVLMNCWQTLLAQYHTLQLPSADHVTA
jgi:hypothetical protein